MAITLPPGLITGLIEGTASAGAGLALPSIFTQINSVLHPQVAAAAPAQQVSAPNPATKTMTVAWATANPTLVPLYMSMNYTIVPGT